MEMTLSPVVDVHTGLPYSNVDVLRLMWARQTACASPRSSPLDARIYREFSAALAVHRPVTKRKIRLGVYSLNLTNHLNPHDIYNNVASPLLGNLRATPPCRRSGSRDRH